MEYFFHLAVLLVIYSILTNSMNFLVGEAGVLMVCHIVFYAIGAYSLAICATVFGISGFIGLLIGVLLSSLVAISIVIIPVRLGGHYLMLASLALCEIVRSISENSSLTGGANGIRIGKSLFGDVNDGVWQLAILSLVVLGIQLILFIVLKRSRFGLLIQCHRADSFLLESSGWNILKIKIYCLVFSAIWAAIAGSLFAQYARYIDPTSFSLFESLLVLLALMVGGIGSIRGSFIAAFLIIVIPGLIRLIDLPATITGPLNQITFGLIVILTMRLRPKGIVGRYLLP